MRLQVVTYSLTGLRGILLKNASSITAQIDGTLTFSIPKTDPLAKLFDGPIALGVEVEALAGAPFNGLTYTQNGEVTCRYIYTAASTSLEDLGELLQVTAICVGDAVFPKLPIYAEDGDPLVYGPDDNPATILADRVARAKARGVDRGITIKDVGGWPTPNPWANQSFKNHQYLSEFYQSLKTGNQANVMWVGTTAYVMPAGALDLDFSRTVIFSMDDFEESPVQLDVTNIAGTVIAEGANGISAMWPVDPAGETVTVSASDVSDPDALTKIAKDEWEQRQEPAREITLTLAMPADPVRMPLRDFHKGTTVSIPKSGGGTESVKVQDITLTGGIDLGASIVVDRKIRTREERDAIQLRAMVGNAASLLGSGAAPSTPTTATADEVPNTAGPGALGAGTFAGYASVTVTLDRPTLLDFWAEGDIAWGAVAVAGVVRIMHTDDNTVVRESRWHYEGMSNNVMRLPTHRSKVYPAGTHHFSLTFVNDQPGPQVFNFWSFIVTPIVLD